MDWPPIPAIVDGIMGPITVRVVAAALDDDGAVVDGTWRSDVRVIEITQSAHPGNEWHTLYHELVHSYMDDLRINVPSRVEELVCDAVGIARVRELVNGGLAPR